MIWTLLLFGISMYVLSKLAFPRIAEALDRRQKAIEESIDAADRTRHEADEILAEYRERLREARGQADEIIERARKAAEVHEREAKEDALATREQLMEQTRRDIETETRRAIQEIRGEVADLTVDGHREGHPQVADRGRPAPAGRGRAVRARLQRAGARSRGA